MEVTGRVVFPPRLIWFSRVGSMVAHVGYLLAPLVCAVTQALDASAQIPHDADVLHEEVAR